MKPKTIRQKRVATLNKRLSPLTDKQAAWARQNVTEHIGYRTSKSVVCMECGQTFPTKTKAENENETVTCPHCHTELHTQKCRKQKNQQIRYFAIVTKIQEFQVTRHFQIKKQSKAGCAASYHITEIVQRWLLPDGSFETIARLKRPFSNFAKDIWSCYSSLEIRPKDKPEYSFYDEMVYPVRRYIPNIKRNGFKGVFYETSAFQLLGFILVSSHAETLLKAKQHSALAYMVNENSETIKKHWNSIKICIRNRYIIPDFSIWKDYLKFLADLGKDLHNAKYVCPKDLMSAHDLLERENLEYRIEDKIKEDSASIKRVCQVYQEEKKRFLGINFSDGLIRVRVLQDIQEFIAESITLKHCVYTSKYYQKEDSLLLSAQINNERTETIEVSLKNFNIIQCRGKCNKNSPYHDKIIGLVNLNMGLIRQARKLQKKQQMQSA